MRKFSDSDFKTRSGRLGAERLDALRDSAGFQDSVTAGLRRVREKFTGDRNVMRRPEVAAKIRGTANGMADPATKASISRRSAPTTRNGRRSAMPSCPHCGQPVPEEPTTAATLLAWCEAAGHRVSADLAVDEETAAAILERSVNTLRNWRAANEGPPYRRRGLIRYRLADLAAYLDADGTER